MVIGIDPGSVKTGWGIIDEDNNRLKLIECGIIRTTSTGISFSEKLAYIFNELVSILSRHSLKYAAVEQVFTSKNAMSALKLGQARGAAIAACASRGLIIHDYEPTLIKSSLVGSGRAQKEQVAFMVKKLLGIKYAEWPLDTSDALAVAICHLSQIRLSGICQRACASLPSSTNTKFCNRGIL